VLEIFKALHISTSYGERKVRFIRSQRKRKGGESESEREREREREGSSLSIISSFGPSFFSVH